MPSTSLKELHIATSMENLIQKSVVDVKGRPTKSLVTGARKLFQAAETAHVLDKDEEQAFVLYSKFIELILVLKDRSDFSTDPSRKCLMEYSNTAIAKAESLKESLVKRYAHLEEAACRKKNEINERISVLRASEPDKNISLEHKVISNIEVTKEKEFEDGSISCSRFFSLLTSGKFVIIMDTRSAEDFTKSHIKHSCCINIPHEILKPG
ncbi:ubiquitin carboxyl-terminal hydrolase 8-like [Stegodyphus dumicola]|uniref:ubiquitin carboxyl-terminal hydrolase 8-like n=1 Tax=Stegodyphus dumicola TaxID=202533 RepID=UPI0015AE657A|nr:ubiquitin carboxyl-terminal hydrolase 8-like [Stegodyphus dumicola]